MAQRLGRNDPCWCGSGKKFKKCHLGRESAAALPPEAIRHAAYRAWDRKECLHPRAGPRVCNQIVSAHTVQRSGVLTRIIDSAKHVWTFYRAPQDAGLNPRKAGWRSASTFTGFCAKHDSETFAPLETTHFAGTDEQCFLIGYRALCHEVYQKKGALRAVPVMRDLADRGQPVGVQEQLQRRCALGGAGTQRGLEDFARLKESMDEQLLAARFSGWSRLIVRFRGDLCVASTGVVSPNRCLDGKELQVLHNLAADQESLLYGVVPTPEGGAVVLTWPTAQTAPRRFLDSLLARGLERLPSLLVQFMFAYVGNTYFSGDWWNSLPTHDRQHLADLARMPNAYYTNFSYVSSRIVPWEVLEVTDEAA